MKVQVLRKADVNVERLAELTCNAMKRDHLLAADAAEETFLDKTLERISRHCYDLVFIARNNREIVGWLALYELSDLGIAQIWNWHPVVFTDENEGEIADALIQEAFSHLNEVGLHKVAIDFRVVDTIPQGQTDRFQSSFADLRIYRWVHRTDRHPPQV